MVYDPYYDQDDFQAHKYSDQPTLRLLDWVYRRTRQGAGSEAPMLSQGLQRLLVAPVAADLDELPLKLSQSEVHSSTSLCSYELQLDLGGIVRCPATLVLPKQPRAPGLIYLCLHGHQHEGRRWTLSEGPAAALSAAGYACLAPELPGLGQLRGETDNAGRGAVAYDLLVHDALLLGWSLNGMRLWLLQKWLAGLRRDPRLGEHAQRFACAGFSLGGELALLLSAIDETIAPIYISHYACPWEASYWQKLHCRCAYVPGLARLTDLEQVYAALVPRPLAVEAGQQDGSFPWPETQALLTSLAERYQQAGAGEHLHILVRPDGHSYRCDASTLAFLDRHSE